MYTSDRFAKVTFDTFKNESNTRPKLDFKLREKVSHWSSAQAQDYFVQTVLDGKKNGYYVEMGSKHPFYKNNTFVLEKIYGWSGLPIDWDIRYKKVWNGTRNDNVKVEDATKLDYNKLVQIEVVDYLSADLANENTLTAVKKFHEDGCVARVITYDHDGVDYSHESHVEESREYLQSKGYHLLITVNEGCEVEDWWVHPDHVDTDRLATMMEMFNPNPGSIFYEFFEPDGG